MGAAPGTIAGRRRYGGPAGELHVACKQEVREWDGRYGQLVDLPAFEPSSGRRES